MQAIASRARIDAQLATEDIALRRIAERAPELESDELVAAVKHVELVVRARVMREVLVALGHQRVR